LNPRMFVHDMGKPLTPWWDDESGDRRLLSLIDDRRRALRKSQHTTVHRVPTMIVSCAFNAPPLHLILSSPDRKHQRQIGGPTSEASEEVGQLITLCIMQLEHG